MLDGPLRPLVYHEYFFSEMVYIGEAVFGVRTTEVKLDRARLARCRDKYARNILELLVSRDDCSNLTIYGEAKDKKAMGKEKLRALRSKLLKKIINCEEKLNYTWTLKTHHHIFALFLQTVYAIKKLLAGFNVLPRIGMNQSLI